MPEVEIYVKGHVDEGWSDWLGGLAMTHTTDGNTVLTGHLRDVSALYGLLSQLPKLGLHLISVSTTSDEISEPAAAVPGSRDGVTNIE